MAITVINVFEMIQIDKQTCQWDGVTYGATELLTYPLLKKAPIVNAGQWVAQSNQFDLFVQSGIFDTGGHDGCQMLQKLGANVFLKAIRVTASQIQAANSLVLSH